MATTLEEYHVDTQPINRYEVTPEGYIRLWVSVAVADKDLEYVTDSGTRIEYIDKENLFDKESLKSAMGKPFTINHPPEPILIENYSLYSVGTSLQEFLNDDSRLVVSGLITDPIAAKAIINKDIQFTSSAYRAVKELQSDGRYKQVKRHYNHFGLLTADESPRAGIESTIILDSTSTKKERMTTNTSPPTAPPVAPTTAPPATLPIIPTVTPQSSPQSPPSTLPSTDSAAMTRLFSMVEALTNQVNTLTAPLIPVAVVTDSADKTTIDNAKLVTDSTTDLVGLWAEWKSTIDQHNKTVDYSLDSTGVKKLVLSCFYNTDTIAKLTDKPTLDGFWINFEADKDARKKSTGNGSNTNQDTTDHRANFVTQTTKKSA